MVIVRPHTARVGKQDDCKTAKPNRRRGARFIATQGASEFSASTRDPPHAADFLLTIAALAARAAALGQTRRRAQ